MLPPFLAQFQDMPDFGGQHDGMPYSLDRLAHNLFRHPVHVHVGGVDVVHAKVHRAMDDSSRFIFHHLAPERHRPQAK